MEKKQVNENSSRQLLSSADQDFETNGAVESLAPPALQLQANGISGEEEMEQEKGAYQLKGKEFTSGADDNPSDNTSPNTTFQLHAAGANNTGLPQNLKSGVENLSGFSLDDVKVHYNSSQPAQLQANAFAQGSDIHIGPGQEKHLPHEAWHVVQQKEGRVQPTRQLKAFKINDDAGLEKEADVMGAKASNQSIEQAGQKIQQKHVDIGTIQGNFFEDTATLGIDEDGDDRNGVEKAMEKGPMEAITGSVDAVGDSSMNLMKRLGKDKLLNSNLSNSGWNKTSDDYKNNVKFNENVNRHPEGHPNAGQAIGDGSGAQEGNLGKATKVFNIAGTAGASLSLISSIASAVNAFGPDGDFDTRLMAILDVGANASSLTSGIAGMVADYSSGDTASKAGKASGAAFYAEGVIKTAKGAYKSIKNIFEAFEAHRGKDGGSDKQYVKSDGREKRERAWEIFTGLMDTGIGVVKTLKHAVSSKFGFVPQGSGLDKLGEAAGGNLMPILGLVMSVIDIAQRVIQLVKAGINKLQVRKRMASLLSSAGLGIQELEENEKGAGFRAKMKTKRNNSKIRRENNKILGKGKKKMFETQNSKDKRSAAEGDLLGNLQSEDDKETYKYLQEMDYINGKRQVRASVHITNDLLNIGGEIANMTGVGATVGVGLKAASAASGVGMGAIRKFKQWGRNRAADKKENEGAKGIWKAFDTDKSSDKKNERRKKDVAFVFKQIGSIDTMNDPKAIVNKVDDIKLFVEATGASFSMFIREFGFKNAGAHQDSKMALRWDIADDKFKGQDANKGIKKSAVFLYEKMKERE